MFIFSIVWCSSSGCSAMENSTPSDRELRIHKRTFTAVKMEVEKILKEKIDLDSFY